MCTSIAMKTDDFYFGRTMDLAYEFNEHVVLTPRKYPFAFRKAGTLPEHYAMLGIAAIVNGYPLYADAVNEKGLCIAGLNFPNSAYYPPQEDAQRDNVSPFELIPWLLGKCASVVEAQILLAHTHLIAIPFSKQIPLTPLHWHIADAESSIVLEVTREGIQVYDNSVQVMTNEPSFGFQMTNLCQYMNLTAKCPQNCFTERVNLQPFGHGLGSFGLPGDFSPGSRFVKAAYLNLNSICDRDEQSSIAQCFHLLDSVAIVKGSVVTPEDECNVTTYSCCMSAGKGIYYYKTYGNNQLTAVDMHRENLEGSTLREFSMVQSQQIAWAN